MESILRTVELEPIELTYLGIGSSPHLQPGQSLDPKNDQLIPQCFHEFLRCDQKSMRLIHFDPDFSRCVEFLHSYFETWNLIPMEFSDGMSWIGEHLEVILLPETIDHTEHFWFFQRLTETLLDQGGKLLIQEYTGHELDTLNKRLYETTQNKDLYKGRILLDMTYGTDIGCSTDMTKAQPFYDYNLDFLNLHFMTEEDALRWARISFKLDEILRRKYVTKYVQALNNIHVDYRRKLKGETLMFGHPNYTESSSPDEIMKVLQDSLSSSFGILLALQVVSREAETTLKRHFLTYKGCDPYKWYESVRKVIPSFKT